MTPHTIAHTDTPIFTDNDIATHTHKLHTHRNTQTQTHFNSYTLIHL